MSPRTVHYLGGHLDGEGAVDGCADHAAVISPAAPLDPHALPGAPWPDHPPHLQPWVGLICDEATA